MSTNYTTLMAKLSDATQKIQAIDKLIEKGTTSMLEGLSLETAMPLTNENMSHLQNERATLKARKDEICDQIKTL